MTTPLSAPRRLGRRPRVLQVSYCCSPTRGSEPGLGWNFALASASCCDTWVIVEENDYGEELRDYLAAHGPIPGLHFEFVPERPWTVPLWRMGLKYVCYNRWQRRVFQVARRLHAEIGFDLAHQVNFISFREPGYVRHLGVPFVWGPLGGTQNFPWAFMNQASPAGAVIESARNIANLLQLRYSRRVRQAADAASALLCANSDCCRAIAALTRTRPQYFSDIMIPEIRGLRHAEPHKELRLLWASGFWTRKALPLLLRALAQLPPDAAYRLRVMGDGSLSKHWRRLAARLGLEDRTEWLGWLPRAEMQRHMEWADAFVFTSLRDTTGTVNVDALSNGLPVICLDHQGVADVINEDCGIKIPVTRPDQVIADLSIAVARLALDPAERTRLSNGALQRAAQYLRSTQTERLCEIYRRVLDLPAPPVATGEPVCV